MKKNTLIELVSDLVIRGIRKAAATVGVGLLGALPAVASIDTFITALPGDVDRKLAELCHQTSMKIIEDAPTGSNLRFVSGLDGVTFLSFVKEDFANKGIQSRKMNEYAKVLFKHLKSKVIREDEMVLASLDLPKVISSLDGQINARSRLLVIGSPQWLSHPDHAFVVADEPDVNLRFRVPSAGHLEASGLTSPFSTLDNESSMANLDVLWWNPVSGITANTKSYPNIVQDFWRSFLAKLEIRMARIQIDLSVFIEDKFSENLTMVSPSYDSGADRVEMLTIADLIAEEARKRVVARIAPPPSAGSVPDSRHVRNATRQIEKKSEGHIAAAGIFWKVKGDIDLHFLGHDSSDTVSFHNKTDESGTAQYVEDKQRGGLGFEMINFNHLPEAGSELWVNAYRLEKKPSEPIEVVYLVRYKGRTVKQAFTMQATEGNQRRDFDKRYSNPNWVRIPLDEVLRSIDGEALASAND
ncbi:hypothetical protein MLD52_09545 [Puniceicoccaceae bacterium K14]|nr:hypothetical protein [Puniceicoccaceae bacterium K14]